MKCLFWSYFECFWLVYFIFSFCYNAFVYLFMPSMHLDFLWLLTMSGRHFHLTTLMKSLSSFLVIGFMVLHAGLINITSEIAFLEGNTIKSSLFFHVYFQKIELQCSVSMMKGLWLSFIMCLLFLLGWYVFLIYFWLFQGLPTISNSIWMHLSPFLIYSQIITVFIFCMNEIPADN